jgi:hypothetical protein
MKNTSEEPKPKIGAGHFGAWMRQGLAELRGAFFNESNVAQPAQYGLYGTRTPGEVADARKIEKQDLHGRNMDEEHSSILADRMRQAEARDEHGRDSRNLEKE